MLDFAPAASLRSFNARRMPAIEASKLTKVYRTYRKERGLWGSIKGSGKAAVR